MMPTRYMGVALAILAAGAAAAATPDEQQALSRPAVLVVLPVSLVSRGPQGGPFSPSAFQYRIRAATGTLSYSIGAPPWLTAEPSDGILDTSGVTVTMTINPSAQALQPGKYAPAVKFTNRTNGRGTTTRTVSLIIAPKTPVFTGGIDQTLSDERGGAVVNDRGERLLAR
jgi:hypothetical protein